jgi:hypothetical protein
VNAEQVIVEKISSAFLIDQRPTDEWIESNPYIFEKISASEAKEYIPAFMVFVLNNMRSDPDSMVYLQLLYAFNNYSKCKSPDNTSQGVWFLLSKQQKNAVLAFLGHLLHNQPINIDKRELNKIINRWHVT